MGEVAMSKTYVDCSVLPAEWDSSEAIRTRLRDGLSLTNIEDKKASVKIPTCVSNYDVLLPVLAQVANGARLAEIDDLRDAIAALYAQHSRQVSDSDVDDDAWALREMMSFVKRKAQRQEPSTVVWP